MKLKLYHYWRSSSSWRVRWALAYKGIPYDPLAVNLLNAETESEEHLARHPLGFVPVLEIGSKKLTESLAIIHYLEQIVPSPSLFLKPQAGAAYDEETAYLQAKVIELTETINADTQPLQNLDPQQLHSSDPAEQKKWAIHWIRRGLSAYEKLCKPVYGRFSVGNQITASDLCLIPQIYNAKRYGIEISDYPILEKIEQNAKLEKSYQESEPSRFEP